MPNFYNKDRATILTTQLIKHIAETFPRKEGAPDSHYAYKRAFPLIAFALDAAFGELEEGDIERDDSSGLRWVQKHIVECSLPNAYFRGFQAKGSAWWVHRLRVIDLAELLFNLQMVPGIHSIYQRLVLDEKNIESTLLELQSIRLLWHAGRTFRVVHSGAGQGLDYDCEVILENGVTVYCEVKCKIETSQFSTGTVKNTLDKAMRQLPANSPGVIIMKVPPSWTKGPRAFANLERAITDKFRKTNRICEVIVYWEELIIGDSHHLTAIRVETIKNRRSPIGALLEPGLLEGRIFSDQRARWIHLIDEGDPAIVKNLLAKVPEDPRGF